MFSTLYIDGQCDIFPMKFLKQQFVTVVILRNIGNLCKRCKRHFIYNKNKMLTPKWLIQIKFNKDFNMQ